MPFSVGSVFESLFHREILSMVVLGKDYKVWNYWFSYSLICNLCVFLDCILYLEDEKWTGD